MNKVMSAFLLISALTLLAVPARAGQSQVRALPSGVSMRPVNIWSDGTRLSGNVFHPEGLKPSDRLPALVLCHGWGGLREHLNRDYAPRFAAAGYVVLTFDYRGWGDSDSRLVLKEPMPALDQKGEATVRVQAIRELVDPFDQVEDITSALDFIEGEPGVDPERIALWGTSYGGGHVLYVAARDPRVKCVISQVGSMDSGAIAEHPAFTEARKNAHRESIKRARGEGVDPVPQGVDKVPNLRGTPFISRMAKYRPVELAPQLKAPILIIDAEKEELFDIKLHGALVYERVKKNVPAKYHVVPGIKHYGIYTTARKEATDMAIEWLDKHLKNGKRPAS